MNKKIIGSMAALVLVMGLSAAENQDIRTLRARKAQLEQSYAASILKLASVLSGMVSAATLSSAAYGVFQSTAIFDRMNASYTYSLDDIVDTGRRLLSGGQSRPSFWQTMKELYTNVLPDRISGAKVVISEPFEWTASSIDKLPYEDQSTLLLGFSVPILTPIGILSGLLSRYLYNKAASYKKEIDELTQQIANLEK